MFVLEDSEMKVLNVQNIDASVKPEETVRGMGLGNRVRW